MASWQVLVQPRLVGHSDAERTTCFRRPRQPGSGGKSLNDLLLYLQKVEQQLRPLRLPAPDSGQFNLLSPDQCRLCTCHAFFQAAASNTGALRCSISGSNHPHTCYSIILPCCAAVSQTAAHQLQAPASCSSCLLRHV